MAHHAPVSVDPKELQRSQAIWANFTKLLKWSVIGIAVTLILMTLAFIG